VHNSINSSKHSYVSTHDDHELMMIYYIQIHLDYFNTKTNYGSKFKIQFLIFIYKKKKHIVCVYGVHSCSLFQNFINFQNIIQHLPKSCPIIILWGFNVDILKEKNHAKKLLDFIEKLKLKSQFSENITRDKP
jgi:hypothetical protein